MIKVLVAEDELPLLRGIKRMIEQLDSDFSVVFCATNGQEGLDYLAQHSVDVVFTDINMPLMSGLELLKSVAGREDGIQTVVISGYDKFEYAQKAMKFGSRNYLLKPIDRDELAGVLAQLKSELSTRSYMRKRERLLRLLFEGAAEDAPQDWGKLTLFCLCAGVFQEQSAANDLPDPVFWSDGALLAYIRRAVKPKGQAWLFWGQNANEALVVTENAPEAFAAQLQAYLLGRMGSPATITIAVGPNECPPGRLASTMYRLRAALARQLVFGKSTILPWARPAAGHRCLPEPLREQLWALTQGGPAEKLPELLLKVREEFEKENYTQNDLEEELVKLVLLLQGENKEQRRAVQHTVKELVYQAKDYDALFAGVTTVCRDYIYGQPFETADKEVLMRTVDDYIQKNVFHMVSTEELSKKFGLVAPYLSKLFKSYKGMSPIQYMQYIRMEKAKQLLVDCPYMLIKDIAERLGYTNALYFSRVFQKCTGVYPSDYRTMNLDENTFKEKE